MNIKELFSLKEKVAIVTGACGLLGRKHVEALAAAGADVVVCDLDQKECEEVVKANGNNHFALAADVADKKSLTEARKKVLKQFGHIDILVNNAAINDMFESPALAAELSKFENYPLELWDKSWKVNVTGVFLCSQIFGSSMAEKGSGSIINIASTYGIVGPDQKVYKDENGEQLFYKSPSYPATKGAVINFTRFLASYWGDKNVRVNTLSPGGVENSQEEWFVKNYSDRTALGRMAIPTDYQGALIFLASDASAYMTGANLVVDGGWTAI